MKRLICVELPSPGYMGFGVHWIINLLSPDRLHDFLFHEELASLGYLGFEDYLIINLLPHDRLRDFLFYVELAFLGYLGVGSSFNYQLASSWPSAWLPLLRRTRIPLLFVFWRSFMYQLTFSCLSACFYLIEDEIYNFICFASPPPSLKEAL